MKVAELMTQDVVTVTPETTLKEVAALLVDRRISGLPVVQADGTVVGVVSEADILVKEQGPEPRHGLLRWLLGARKDDERLLARTAEEAMTAPAITVRAASSVSHAARLMTQNGVKRLPVLNRNDRLVGIVTRSDLVRAFTRSDAEIALDIRDGVIRGTLWLGGSEPDIAVQDGVVTLSGEVERRSDVELLELFTARVPGVVSVESNVGWRWDDEKRPAGPRASKVST